MDYERRKRKSVFEQKDHNLYIQKIITINNYIIISDNTIITMMKYSNITRT